MAVCWPETAPDALTIDIAALPWKMRLWERLRSSYLTRKSPKPSRGNGAEFEAAARRPLKLRMRYALIRTYKPVLDDAPFRPWDSTAQYRSRCESNLPGWLGYGRV